MSTGGGQTIGNGAVDEREVLPDLADLDGFWAAPLAERARVFAELRARPGLPFCSEPDPGFVPRGPGYWAVTRRDDVLAATRQPTVFTSGRGAAGVAELPPEAAEFYNSMINMDDPRHGRLRRIVSRGFTPKRLAALVENVERVARSTVDAVVDDGECDAVAAIATPLPLKIICNMMGVPESHHGFVLERTNVILGAYDPEYVPEVQDALAAMRRAGSDLAGLMRDLGAYRMVHPTDDVTSVLVNARVDGEALTPDELASFFTLLVTAGNETTRHAISWGLHLLTEHPDQRAVWLADLDAVTPTAVEEIVRWSSPAIFARRTLSCDAVLGGQPMRAGDKVLLFYWAANRDPVCFADPDGFDVRRLPNPHVGFGGPGPHICLGAHLARRELAVVFRELLTRVPDIHATAEPQRLRSMFVNGVKRLPVAFTPGGRR